MLSIFLLYFVIDDYWLVPKKMVICFDLNTLQQFQADLFCLVVKKGMMELEILCFPQFYEQSIVCFCFSRSFSGFSGGFFGDLTDEVLWVTF